MKTLSACLIVPAVLAGVGYCLCAQEADMRTTGKVLLLRNGHTMEGDIEKVGTQMRVRKGASEIWLSADLAARLCADWDDAYLFMQTLIKIDSAGDHVKLARWCNMQNMNDKALEQARIALSLQPDHAGAKQIVTLLERTMNKQAAKPAPTASAAPTTPVSTAVKSEPAFVDVSAETTIAFTTKVQPILMNTCANCHATGNGGKLVIERGDGQKAATQRNLAAVLAYVDLDRPTISPLLVKAVSPHGGGSAALKDRSSKPFIALKDWIDQTIAKNPQLKDYQAARKGSKIDAAPKTGFGSQRSSAAPIEREPMVALQQEEAAQSPREREWCDPEIFNDWAHPRVNLQQSARNR